MNPGRPGQEGPQQSSGNDRDMYDLADATFSCTPLPIEAANRFYRQLVLYVPFRPDAADAIVSGGK